ncbi:MAG: hypothetical protein HYY17_00205 [Planctomycetes bacterium]|nr:hypothetical protein [Planctomycetota bacterium]
MPSGTYTLTLPGPMLERGFWLYVWRTETPEGEYLYVGRTGDNSSPNATPPYQRMGQHLGHAKTQNALRQHLERHGIAPERCTQFHLIAHGPLFPEAADMAAHVGPRDVVAALEKALADNLLASGYRVLNTVNCRKILDPKLWSEVRAAFARHFPKLRGPSGEGA